MPRVSILLPVHQAEATLAACLASIQRQRETRWECIAVDDGSHDASPAMLRAWARRDARVQLVCTPHRGPVSALETGLARCRVRIFPRAGLRDGRLEYERWLNGIESPESVLREAFVECPIAHPSLVVRRDLLQRFGYRDCGWPEDYDLVLRLLAACCELAVHPRRLLAWRDGPARLSRRRSDLVWSPRPPPREPEVSTTVVPYQLRSGSTSEYGRYINHSTGSPGAGASAGLALAVAHRGCRAAGSARRRARARFDGVGTIESGGFAGHASPSRPDRWVHRREEASRITAPCGSGRRWVPRADCIRPPARAGGFAARAWRRAGKRGELGYARRDLAEAELRSRDPALRRSDQSDGGGRATTF